MSFNEKAHPPITLEIVINTCYGGYSLSQVAAEEVLKRKGIPYRLQSYGQYSVPIVGDNWETVNDVVSRSDPVLVAVVREMGAMANGDCAKLKIVKYAIDTEISNFDGKESVSICGSLLS